MGPQEPQAEVGLACTSMKNSLEDARTHSGATNMLFDVYAQEYLRAHRPNFLRLLPAIRRKWRETFHVQALMQLCARQRTSLLPGGPNALHSRRALSNPGFWHGLSDEFLPLMKEEHALLRGTNEPPMSRVRS
jgi:hypothetical protein